MKTSAQDQLKDFILDVVTCFVIRIPVLNFT